MAHLHQIHVVEQDQSRTGVDGFGQLLQGFDLGLDGHVAARDRFSPAQGGGDDVIFLDQDAIVESATMIAFATAADGELLASSKPGNVLRVSTIRAEVPAMASTLRRVTVGVPDNNFRKLCAGLSAESCARVSAAISQSVNPAEVPDNHLFKLTFFGQDDSVKAEMYRFIDETSGDTLFRLGYDFKGEGSGPTALGLLPVVTSIDTFKVDSTKTGFVAGSPTNASLTVRYSAVRPINLKRPNYPENLRIEFSDQVLDTSKAFPGFQAKPAMFRITAVKSDGTESKLNFKFYDKNNSKTLDQPDDYIEIQTYQTKAPTVAIPTWNIKLDTVGQWQRGPLVPPSKGDEYRFVINKPLGSQDEFTFRSIGQKFDQNLANSQFNNKPYVVPNPYVAAASFEPQRFGVQGRGERKLEFRNLPPNCTIRIYTVTGELVQTLQHDGNILNGYVPWDLRTKDNLEAAPGLYIFHVDAGQAGVHTGKFAIVK